MLLGCYVISDDNRTILGHDRNSSLPVWYRLVGLVVKASASRAEDPGFGFEGPVCDGIFPGLSHTSDLEIGHYSGYPAWDWLARCQYTVTG